MNSIITQAGQTKLQTDADLGLHLVDQQYNGNWQVLQGKLWKSDFVVNNNTVMQFLKQEIGDDVGIYQGSTLVATSIKSGNSKFATGEQASSALVQTVLHDHKVFVGRLQLAEMPYLVAAQPIRDPSQKAIGIWLVGEPLETYVEQENSMWNRMLLVGLLILLIGLGVEWFVTRRLTMPLATLVDLTGNIASADLREFEPVPSNE